jgi:threonine aldolase
MTRKSILTVDPPFVLQCALRDAPEANMVIDLRSDTVTLPSPSMRAAIGAAELGDDVFGEDPTVNRLEARVAEITGKDTSVFVASGTMGNLSALLGHCARGQSAIVGDESHIFHYEAGGAAAFGGIAYHTVPTRADGTLPLEAIEAAIKLPRDIHGSPTGVICLENTHNRGGGVVVGDDYVAEVAAIARRIGVPLHLDGARLFNAAVATGKPITAWTRHVTTVMLCLSKGLGAPVGSMVAGPREVITRVRKARKMLGGSMRQAGVLAAAGLVALDEMIDRLAEDHANARRLAEGLARLPGLQLDLETVVTNIVIFRLEEGIDADRLIDELRRAGVLIVAMGGGRLRAVTHYGISAADCDQAVEVFARVLERLEGASAVKERGLLDALQGRR